MNKRTSSAGAHIFVTGLGGFIGPAVAEGLLAAGYKVSGLVRQSTRPTPEVDRLKGKVDLYTGDLNDFSGLRQILTAAAPDHIIHFAALSSVAASFDRPIIVNQNNYIGNLNLAEAARQALPELKSFAFSSSMEVYGAQELAPFTEDMEPHPRAPYAVSKLAFEKYLEMLHANYGFPSVSIRQTNAYGRLTNTYFVVEAIITQMLRDKVVNLGRKEPVRNFVHIDDLVALYVTMVKEIEAGNKNLFGQVFNTGPNNGLSIGDLQALIADEMGWEGVVNWGSREIRAGEVFCLDSANDKISKVLEWAPRIGLRDGLARTIAYWKNKI